jgi:hypothetical protein
MGAASLNYIFSTPPVAVEGSNEKLVDSLLKYDFDRDAPKIYAKDETFKESAMDFMAPPEVDDPKLAAFRKAGRKMIIYHGQADPVFSVNSTIRWYEKFAGNAKGDAAGAVRLFPLPGGTHCGGGITLEKFDALTALTDWVEKGRPPTGSSRRSMLRTRRFRRPGVRPARARSVPIPPMPPIPDRATSKMRRASSAGSASVWSVSRMNQFIGAPRACALRPAAPSSGGRRPVPPC